ncbi:MAG: hypothetical protein NW237_17630 [Cyanobacteriota bacterium]|nr:hypothetical protein [Cyanobacteriota bacterium]
MATTKKITVSFSSADDLELLERIELQVGSLSSGNFSELCKQALRAFLASTPPATLPGEDSAVGRAESDAVVNEVVLADPAIAIMQQQLIALDERLRSLESGQQRLPKLEKELSKLAQAVQALREPSVEAPQPTPAKPDYSRDPLLSRLGPLLESF